MNYIEPRSRAAASRIVFVSEPVGDAVADADFANSGALRDGHLSSDFTTSVTEPFGAGDTVLGRRGGAQSPHVSWGEHVAPRPLGR